MCQVTICLYTDAMLFLSYTPSFALLLSSAVLKV